jgi:hypothetical protein
MTGALERVFKQAELLPEDAQLELAGVIEQKLSDLRWEQLFSTPESRAFLRKLEQEADDEQDLQDLKTVL